MGDDLKTVDLATIDTSYICTLRNVQSGAERKCVADSKQQVLWLTSRRMVKRRRRIPEERKQDALSIQLWDEVNRYLQKHDTASDSASPDDMNWTELMDSLETDYARDMLKAWLFIMFKDVDLK